MTVGRLLPLVTVYCIFVSPAIQFDDSSVISNRYNEVVKTIILNVFSIKLIPLFKDYLAIQHANTLSSFFVKLGAEMFEISYQMNQLKSKTVSCSVFQRNVTGNQSFLL